MFQISLLAWKTLHLLWGDRRWLCWPTCFRYSQYLLTRKFSLWISIQCQQTGDENIENRQLGKVSWCTTKFSELTVSEIYDDQKGEIRIHTWNMGLEGLISECVYCKDDHYAVADLGEGLPPCGPPPYTVNRSHSAQIRHCHAIINNCQFN